MVDQSRAPPLAMRRVWGALRRGHHARAGTGVSRNGLAGVVSSRPSKKKCFRLASEGIAHEERNASAWRMPTNARARARIPRRRSMRSSTSLSVARWHWRNTAQYTRGMNVFDVGLGRGTVIVLALAIGTSRPTRVTYEVCFVEFGVFPQIGNAISTCLPSIPTTRPGPRGMRRTTDCARFVA